MLWAIFQSSYKFDFILLIAKNINNFYVNTKKKKPSISQLVLFHECRATFLICIFKKWAIMKSKIRTLFPCEWTRNVIFEEIPREEVGGQRIFRRMFLDGCFPRSYGRRIWSARTAVRHQSSSSSSVQRRYDKMFAAKHQPLHQWNMIFLGIW